MKKLAGDSLNIMEENLTAMQQLFPEAFEEGKIDFEVLRQLLGDYVDDEEERYSFRWNGKGKALLLSQTPSTGTLRPCKEESKDWDTTENLYIEGDNLEVLKLLQKSYHGKVKMIYIDPPYNTGKDFVYKDDFRDNVGVCQEFCVNHFSACHVIVFHEFRHTLIHQQLVANERPVWYPAP